MDRLVTHRWLLKDMCRVSTIEIVWFEIFFYFSQSWEKILYFLFISSFYWENISLMYLSYVETSRLDTSGLLNVSNNVLKIFSLLINQINKLHFQIVEMKTLIFFIIKMFVKYLKSNFLVIPGWLAHSTLSIYFINIPLSTFNNIYKFGGNYLEKKTFKH